MGLISYIRSMFSKPKEMATPKEITEGIVLEKFPTPEGIGKLPETKLTQEPVLTVVPTRARNKKGRYVQDDKSTADVNEAWAGGKAPKKKAKKKVSKKKK